MTGTGVRSARGRQALAAVRWGGAITAAVALAALVAIGPLGPAARAASTDSYNQMTGVGKTASAVAVNWTQGLLDSQNQPITAPGDELAPNADRASGTGPLSFMYNDFKNLQVTVSQTEDITHQGITVTWSGAGPTLKTVTPLTNFIEMMECYGDSDTGPSPEDCEYGSAGMLVSGANATAGNPAIGTRTGFLCGAGSVPDPANPPAGPAGDPGFGCDTFEPGSASAPHCDPAAPAGNACTDGVFAVPFVPVDDPTHPIYQQQDLPTYFSEFNTNEVQDAITSLKGRGQQQFETLTKVQAPGLGCGGLESDGQPRDCWLVIVPRGTFEPNGYAPHGVQSPDGYIDSSPLSASNWAQRIQVHLSYAPLGVVCPPDTLPNLVVGTQVISRAMSSWEFALNTAAKCSRVYAFTATTETTSTQQLQTPQVGNAGMAFTTIPIGAEAARYPGGHPPSLPPILYAPVAVTALDFGFNINEGTGYDTTPVNLTPMLTAKAVSQVYRTDLPDYVSGDEQHPGPKWAQQNPTNFTLDHAFQKINTLVTPYVLAGIPIAPLLTLDHSALNQQVWQWMQTDPATGSWLDGTPAKSDPVAADPDYVSLKLGKAPAPDSWPRAYTGKLDNGPCPVSVCTGENPKNPKEMVLLTQDLLPEEPDFDTAASTVLAANDPTETGNSWSLSNKAPDGTPGWWGANGTQPVGQIFMWSLGDMPDMAAYGLIGAALCDATGKNCLAPSVADVSKTLHSATADSQGLLQVDPARVPAGGYPLVDVVYAAVATKQSAAALNSYADLIAYAAAQGQVTGSNPGDLPPGYLPLPASLQKQAMATVAKLRAIANPPSHSPTPTHSATATHTPTQSQSSTTAPSSTPTQSPSPTSTAATGTPAPAVAARLPRRPTRKAAWAARPARPRRGGQSPSRRRRRSPPAQPRPIPPAGSGGRSSPC